MRKILIIFVSLLSIVYTNHVVASDFHAAKVKSFVENTPRNKEDKILTLAQYLTKPFNDDYYKAMAIAFWIAGHIYYDNYLYNNGKTTRLMKSYRGQSAKDLLKSRVGICEDFAELFVVLCQAAGIKAHKIHGYVYPTRTLVTTNLLQNSAHAWNYFMYKNKKIYVDTTFMSKASTNFSSGLATNLRHRQALREIRMDNRRSSQFNDFNDYYFDFSYKDEERNRGLKRQESR